MHFVIIMIIIDLFAIIVAPLARSHASRSYRGSSRSTEQLSPDLGRDLVVVVHFQQRLQTPPVGRAQVQLVALCKRKQRLMPNHL